MTIEVKEIIKSPIAAFHSDGLAVFAHLQNAYSNNKAVNLSFQGVEHCSTQFLNASIGKLYLQFEAAIIDSLLKYDTASIPHLAQKIEEVRENAINSKEYDSLIDNAIAY